MKRINDLEKARRDKLDFYEDSFDELGIDLPDMVKSSRASMANIGHFLIKSDLFEEDELKLILATDLEEPAMLDDESTDPDAINEALSQARSRDT